VTEPRWYVIGTESRAEYLAAVALARDEFEVFFPRIKSPHDRIGHNDSPLFPGYLFLRLDLDGDGWPTFNLIHRVRGLVRFGGEVPWVPDSFISDLADQMKGLNSGSGLWRRFRIGEKVRVVSAGLESLAEVVEEAKSPQARSKVLMEFMGRLVQAQVPWTDLRPIEQNSWETQRSSRRTRGRGRWVRGFGPRGPASA